MQHMLRAVRIVQIQQRRLRKRIRLALRHRVLRIALQLDRPERIRLHQHRNRARRERIRRRKVHRLAENQVLGLLDVREDRLVRLLRATRQSSQRQRSAHHLQEPAPAHRIDPLVRSSLPWELLAHQLLELRRIRQLIQVLPEATPRLAIQLGANLRQRHLRRCNLRHHHGLCCRCFHLSHRLVCSIPRRLQSGLHHRWHVSQLDSCSGLRMWYCAVRYLPKSIWLVNFV